MRKFKLDYTRLPQEYLAPLYNWSQAEPGSEERQAHWDEYCDIRDCVPSGTSRAYRLRNEWAPGEAPAFPNNVFRLAGLV
jgi:hypothetical protein